MKRLPCGVWALRPPKSCVGWVTGLGSSWRWWELSDPLCPSLRLGHVSLKERKISGELISSLREGWDRVDREGQ